ncbi:MAG: ribonuclease III [Acholeplasmatales bacterium]|nr:ribonuclease III [Acholeplasmatales bacterium]
MEANISNASLLNGLTLAYIGDAIYEVYIRNYVISLGYTKVNTIHKMVIKYTSGNAQASFIHYFLDNKILNEEEISIFKRGRNSHIKSNRKNINIQDYLDATGFEALFGYLYLSNNIKRLEELINIIIEYRKEC